MSVNDRLHLRIGLFILGVMGLASPAHAVRPTADEFSQAQRWVTTHLNGADPQQVPFSFLYEGKPWRELAHDWKVQHHVRHIDKNRTEHTIRWSDPKTGLVVRCVALQYSDFPTVEWTLYFSNTSAADTPIISNIQALDTAWQCSGDGEFLLHHAIGSPADGSDYGPRETPLGAGVKKRITAKGGRPSNSDMPYFNLQWGREGVIIVVGWPGQWAAEFSHDRGQTVKVHAGQELTHFKLHPGEQVRSPRMVLQFWRGDWIRAQDIWRRWMMAHNMPRPGGMLPSPQLLASSSRAYGEMIGANEQNQIMHIKRYLEEGIKLDYWWMDAGWYIQQKGWPQVGTWEVDPKRFPHGFKPISDFAHSKGIKILVWFEPERVAAGTWLYENHPEWLLRKPNASSNSIGGLCQRHSRKCGDLPCVTHNPTTRTLSTVGIHWQPGRLAFHPGPKGEYSVVRFTAPTSDRYIVDAAFLAIDPKATTRGYILHNGRGLFNAGINIDGKGSRAQSHLQLRVEKNDTIDFVLGYGNGDYGFDSTGLEVVLHAAHGKTYDAAKQCKLKQDPNGPWSYGYLPPGVKPNASAFQLYDVYQVQDDSRSRLLNLGDPAARKWLTDHIDRILTREGIDLYRQDFNIDPLAFWRAHDTEDRQGITEIKYVTGYLAYWDELLRRHPNMLIDSCASGGRRNDLETMRRAVPLWRSDYAFEPVGHQCMTYGISFWIPFHGTGTVACANSPYYGSGPTPIEPYAFWSNCAPSLVLALDVRVKQLDYRTLRRLIKQWRQVSPFYHGDYYPLTSYRRDNAVWIAWQFDRPEQCDGMIQAFRRGDSPYEVARFQLHGLDDDTRYRFTKVGSSDSSEATGRELKRTGLEVTIADKPGVAVITYHRVSDSKTNHR